MISQLWVSKNLGGDPFLGLPVERTEIFGGTEVGPTYPKCPGLCCGPSLKIDGFGAEVM